MRRARLIVPPFLRTLDWSPVDKPKYGTGALWNVLQIVRTIVYPGDDPTERLNQHLAVIDMALRLGVRYVHNDDGGPYGITITGGAAFFSAMEGQTALRFEGVFLAGRALQFRVVSPPSQWPETCEWLSDIGLKPIPLF